MDYLYNGRDGVITDTEDLYYMRARYYSTDLRRFTSEDTFVGKYDNLLGLNLYGYVNGNPVQYVDPSGYDKYRLDHLEEARRQAAYYYAIAGGAEVQSVAISFIPVIGDGKDFQEAVFGIDLVTGETLSLGQRGVTFVCAFIPILSGKGANAAIDGTGDLYRAFSKGGLETGIIAKNGIKIEGFTSHGVDRAIGDGMKRAGVKPESILDAIKNPLKINDVVTDQFGRQSQRFIGETAEVVINPLTGKIVSINPTSSSKAAKLLKELGVQK